MVALCAQRVGLSTRAYVYSRTPSDVMLDIEAWVASWAFPASVIAGGRGGEEEGAGRRPGGAGRRPGRSRDLLEQRPWLRKLRRPLGRNVIVNDLDEIAKMEPAAAEAALRASGLAKATRKKMANGKIVPVTAEISPVLVDPSRAQARQIAAQRRARESAAKLKKRSSAPEG